MSHRVVIPSVSVCTDGHYERHAHASSNDDRDYDAHDGISERVDRASGLRRGGGVGLWPDAARWSDLSFDRRVERFYRHANA